MRSTWGDAAWGMWQVDVLLRRDSAVRGAVRAFGYPIAGVPGAGCGLAHGHSTGTVIGSLIGAWRMTTET